MKLSSIERIFEIASDGQDCSDKVQWRHEGQSFLVSRRKMWSIYRHLDNYRFRRLPPVSALFFGTSISSFSALFLSFSALCLSFSAPPPDLVPGVMFLRGLPGVCVFPFRHYIFPFRHYVFPFRHYWIYCIYY
jgi:hypothetical protein